ncbi:heat shock protein 70 family, partial [Dactylonectria estremocensis]
PEEVFAFLFTKIQAAIIARFRTTAIKWVLTVPSHSNTAQKTSTRDTVKIAGLGHARLVEEPVATALKFIPSNRLTRSLTALLVVDMGGGTTDVTLVHLD